MTSHTALLDRVRKLLANGPQCVRGRPSAVGGTLAAWISRDEGTRRAFVRPWSIVVSGRGCAPAVSFSRVARPGGVNLAPRTPLFLLAWNGTPLFSPVQGANIFSPFGARQAARKHLDVALRWPSATLEQF